MVCVESVFFSFFLSFFVGIFLTDTNDSQDGRDDWGNHCFSCFPLPHAYEYSFSSSKFLPFFFKAIYSNYQIDSWWDFFSLEICILFPFLLMQLIWELLTFEFQSDIVRIQAHINLLPSYYKENALTNWNWHF